MRNQRSFLTQKRFLWRGSLLPLECAALARSFAWTEFGAASQPSGSKLPCHRLCIGGSQEDSPAGAGRGVIAVGEIQLAACRIEAQV